MSQIDVFHDLPLTFEDRREPTPVPDFQEGQPTLAAGYPERLEEKTASKAPVLVITMLSEGGRFWVKFFHYTRWHTDYFGSGQHIHVWGTPIRERKLWTFFHPSLPKEIGNVYPIYAQPQGQSNASTQAKARDTIDYLLQHLTEEVPPELLVRRQLPPIAESLLAIHAPKEIPHKKHFLRLAYREMFLLTLKSIQQKATATPIDAQKAIQPWQGTINPSNDQRTALEKIRPKLNTQRPMKHLLIAGTHTAKEAVATEVAKIAINAKKTILLAVPPGKPLGKHRDSWAPKIPQTTVTILPPSGRLTEGAINIANHSQLDTAQRPDILILEEGPHYRHAQIDRLLDSESHCLQMTSAPITTGENEILNLLFNTTVVTDNPTQQQTKTTVTNKQQAEAVIQSIDQAMASGQKVLIIYPKPTTKHEGHAQIADAYRYWSARHPGKISSHTTGKKGKEDPIALFSEHAGPMIFLAEHNERSIPRMPQVAVVVIAKAERFQIRSLQTMKSLACGNGQKSYCFLIASTEEQAASIKPLESITNPLQAADLAEELSAKEQHPGADTYQGVFAMPSTKIYSKVTPWVLEDIHTCIDLGIIPCATSQYPEKETNQGLQKG